MYIATPNIDSLLDIAASLNLKADEKVIFFFAEQTELDYLDLIARLNEHKVQFIGGIFPGVIYGNQSYGEGVIVQKVKSSYLLELNLNEEVILDSAMLQQLQDSDEKQLALICLDGLSPYISTFLLALYDQLGNMVNYIGGGAGSMSLQRQKCLLSSSGMHQDKALICIIPQKVGLGVKHGWESIYGPLVATKTNHNIIHELNWQNAFEVYKELVDEDSGANLEIGNFFDLSKAYPFGISVDGDEDIVRDPIAVLPDGGIVCVGEIRTNVVLQLLKGNVETLIASAEKAIVKAIDTLSDDDIQMVFVVDCISRRLFLEDNFQKELDAFNKYLPYLQRPIRGLLTLGEVSAGGGQLRYYNKTIVVAALA